MEVVRWPRRKRQSQKGEDKGKKGGCHHRHHPGDRPLAACLLLPQSLFLIHMPCIRGRHLLCSQSQLSSHLQSSSPQIARLPDPDPETPLSGCFICISVSWFVNQHPAMSLLSISSILVGCHPEREMARRNKAQRKIKKR